MPVLEYGMVGVPVNGLWKYGFQRAIEKRDVKRSPRPVFLLVDEAQFLLTSHDHQFLSTCRSSKVATMFLTQNISSFYAALGGKQAAEAEIDALCGNLCTKVFCCNGDSVNNKWAAEMVGQSRQMFRSSSNSFSSRDAIPDLFGVGNGLQSTAGTSEHMAYSIEPSVFTTLRSGGHGNQGCVDTVVFVSGKTFETGTAWRFHTFHQDG